MSNKPIGVFDSGIGGLTVLKALRQQLPNESYVYFGDTGRVPYGTKSPETIRRYANEIADFLLGQNIKLLVVACNSASSCALEELQKKMPIPVVGVIEPGARKAVSLSQSKQVAVLGTKTTVNSNVYRNQMQSIDPTVSVFQIPCPLFVPIVEENWIFHPSSRLIVREYLSRIDQKVDTVVLGCTHYPFLSRLIQEQLGEDVTIVDSAFSCAEAVAISLENNNLKANSRKGDVFFTSDDVDSFQRMGTFFLGDLWEGSVNLLNHLS